jgi:2'-5' RNA ligase
MPSPSKTIRLFVGTAISSEQAKRLEHAGGADISAPHWRIAPLAQWHVTALFLGERDARYLEDYRIKVARVAERTPPIELVEGRMVTMPKTDPTMLWTRFQPHPGLTQLHHDLAAEFGVEPSHYIPYWPHITMGRSKGKPPEIVDGPVLVKELMLRELTLFRSMPGERGSVHDPLATWPLSGRGPLGPEVAG